MIGSSGGGGRYDAGSPEPMYRVPSLCKHRPAFPALLIITGPLAKGKPKTPLKAHRPSPQMVGTTSPLWVHNGRQSRTVQDVCDGSFDGLQPKCRHHLEEDRGARD